MSKNKGKSYRKETLEATIRKQKECSAKALKIVEKLIEQNVTEDLLLQSINFINQATYQDIIDERSITNMCGYPVCNDDLKNIPKHQYKITRTNGTLLLYDTTERKKFCSNICYKSAKYLKDQLPTCPLWLIESKDTESIHLLKIEAKNVGTFGEPINFNSTNEKELDQDLNSFVNTIKNDNKKTNLHTSDNEHLDCTKKDIKTDGTEDNLNKFDDNFISAKVSDTKDDDEFVDAIDSEENLFVEVCDNISNNIGNSNNNNNTFNDVQDVNLSEIVNKCDINDSNDSSYNNVSISKSIVEKCESQTVLSKNKLIIESCDNNSEVIDKKLESSIKNENDTEECNQLMLNKSTVMNEIKPDKNDCQNKIKKSKHRNKTKKKSDISPMLAAVLRTEQCIREWISLDTLVFLLGEDKLKEIIEETCGLEKFKTHSQNTMRDPVVYERYLAICKKLNLLELHESKLDNSYKNDTVIGPTKPVPDFERLKEEAKEMEIKVRAFFKGDKQVQFKEGSSEEKNNKEPVVIPLVDQHAQKALRRRILLDHLNRVLPDLLRTLGLSKFSSNLMSEVKRLVETFTLSAHNVMFRPAEWNFVAIVIIKLLSVQNHSLKQLLSSEKVDKYLTLMLMSYEQDSGYLNRIITWLLYEHALFFS